MQKILIMQATEGMVLARAVENTEGRVLCGKGTRLTTSLLDRLRKMGISHVTVEGHPIEEPGQKTLQEELWEIEERFSRVKHIPPLMYIKKLIMKQTIAGRKSR